MISEELKQKLMRWAALPVTSRRWAAPLSALALGFGLFVGVALSPNTAGTLAGGPQLIEMPSLLAGEDQPEGAEGENEAAGLGVEPESSAPVSGETFSESTEFDEASPETVTPDESNTLPEMSEPEASEEEGPTESAVLEGVVVHVNPAAGSYAVAEGAGAMSAVHAPNLPKPGAKVAVPIRALANGTLVEDGKRKAAGTADQVKLTGVVSFVDPTRAAPAYAVSNLGVSVLVRVPADPGGATPQLPELGAYATVDARIEVPAVPAPAVTPPTVDPSLAPPPCAADPAQAGVPPVEPEATLWQTKVSAGGAPFPSSAFEGIVAGICPQTGQVLISADDIRAAGVDLVFTVPPQLKLSKLVVGDSVIANAIFEDDGALTLTGIASDEQAKRADDPALTQGDLKAKAKEKK